MAFTVRDYQDLVALLKQHPEWQDELRRLLLHEDFLQLPQIVRELAEAQQRTERRIEELAEAQRRSEERLTRLEERLERLEAVVAELAEAQRRTERRIEELAEAQRRSEERLTRLEAVVAELAEAQRRTEQHVQRLTDRVASLDGKMLEIEFERKAAAYLGPILRRVRVLDRLEVEERVEEYLSTDQIAEIFRLDAIVQGQLHKGLLGEEQPHVWLAVEVSSVVDRQDVERAAQRARLLRSAGLTVIPVVAGEAATVGGEESAAKQGVLLLQDGKIDNLDEALRDSGLKH